MRARPTSYKLALATIFLVCMTAQLVGIGWLWVHDQVYADDASRVIIGLLKIYSVPLGVIMAGIFARRKATTHSFAPAPFIVAIAVSAIWNVLLMGRTAAFMLAEAERPSTYMGDLETLAGAATFLVAAAIAYFFSTDGSEEVRETRGVKA